MRVNKPWWIPLMMALTFVWGVNTVDARIPEPDNIVYGIMPAQNSLFSLKVNDEIIAQYNRGENPDAGEYFILRVPIDSLDPQEAGTARTGNQALVYLDAETQPAVIVTVGERGAVQRVVLASANDDGDTILNGVDNCPDTANNDQDDADGDGQGDACDGNSDTDSDGYTDMVEYNNIKANTLDPAGQPFNLLVKNAPGGLDFIDPQTMLANAITILQIMTGLAVDCSECTIDIGNDGIFGIPEAIDSLRSAAGL